MDESRFSDFQYTAVVVAKPALTNPDKAKDYCLAYNNAEIKLARSMTPVQKKVVLFASFRSIF
jgi:hypothetical protein